MIRVRNESDLKNWFKKNYKKLGFDKILRQDVGQFPDFIMEKNGKEVKVELEIKSSNFIMHEHSIDGVDEVICIEKDVELGVPVRELNNLRVIEFNENSHYSLESQIYSLLKKEKILTNSDVAEKLKIHTATAQSKLLDLVIDGKVERMKKKGVTLWILK